MKKVIAGDLLSEKFEAAFQRAAENVVRIAKATGTPILVSVNGKMKKVPYHQYEYLLETKPLTGKRQRK